MSPIKVCVFDAYGTLFDVAAAARAVAQAPGREAFSVIWQQVATDWRLKQLQYSWLRTLTDEYRDFWGITQDALDWALEAADQTDPELRETLLGLYWSLAAYPEVPEVLGQLQAKGLGVGILSNGSKEMLDGAVDSAGIRGMLDHVLSVEDLQLYKPRPEVYDMVGAAYGVDRSEVLLVSSNNWDVAGAASYGFQTLWVNRAGEPVDRLAGQPGRVASDLTAVLEIVA